MPSHDSHNPLAAKADSEAPKSKAYAPSYDSEKHERPATVSSSSAYDDDDDNSSTNRDRANSNASLSRIGSAASRTSRLSRTVSEVRDGISNQRDLELGDSEEDDAEKAAEAQGPVDPNLVKWNGRDDPENPKNWDLKKKWAAVVCGKSKQERIYI
jgi:hypothetical protein